MENDLTLQESISIVDTFAVWDKKDENFDRALEKVLEAAETLNNVFGDLNAKGVKIKVEAGKANAFAEGFDKGVRDTEEKMFGDWFLKLRSEGIDPSKCSEITFEDCHGRDAVQFEPVREGHWEPCEPDYDREGNRILSHVVICSECQKPAKLPRTRYCPNCGSWNEERSD